VLGTAWTSLLSRSSSQRSSQTSRPPPATAEGFFRWSPRSSWRSPYDLALIYRCSEATVYNTIDAVIDAIHLRCRDDVCTYAGPYDEAFYARMDEMAEGFTNAPNNKGGRFRGVVGCIDGCHFTTKSPGVKVDNPRRYHVSRKDKFGLLFSAICDIKRRFNWFDCSYCPQTHDSVAWGGTQLGKEVSSGRFPKQYCFLGDSAYNVGPSMLTPYPGSHLPSSQDGYNWQQSSLRMCIECAFGMLIRRWGILWRPLEGEVDRRSLVVGACMLFHNHCIDCGSEMDRVRINRRGLAKMDRQCFDVPGGALTPCHVRLFGDDGLALDLTGRAQPYAHRDVLDEPSARNAVEHRDEVCAALALHPAVLRPHSSAVRCGGGAGA